MLSVTHRQFLIIEQATRGRRYRLSYVKPLDRKIWESLVTAGVATKNAEEYVLSESVKDLYRQQRVVIEGTRLSRSSKDRIKND